TRRCRRAVGRRGGTAGDGTGAVETNRSFHGAKRGQECGRVPGCEEITTGDVNEEKDNATGTLSQHHPATHRPRRARPGGRRRAQFAAIELREYLLYMRGDYLPA